MHRIFFKVVHLPFPTRYNVVSGSPLLKRACPTADAVMRGGEGMKACLLVGRGGVLCSITFHVYKLICWFCVTSVINNFFVIKII